MSGHSKWSTIKRQKGAQDAKRGKTFTKIANSITIAVKQGGGIDDPSQNPKLRLAVDMAKTENMPKANIDRAIERASSKEEGNLYEVLYEGFAPGGVSIIIEAVSDNTNRTTPEIKSLFNKHNARFGQPGSAIHLFNQVGEIVLEKNGKSIDDIFLTAADFGAEDVEDMGDRVIIYTSTTNLSKVKKKLEEELFRVESADIIRKPITYLTIEEEDLLKLIKFIDELEEMDDVQKVYIDTKI